MKTRQIILELDDDDWQTVQDYIADFQAASAKISAMSGNGGSGTILPEGDSNLAGAIMAECVRDLLEYRQLFDAQRGDDL